MAIWQFGLYIVPASSSGALHRFDVESAWDVVPQPQILTAVGAVIPRRKDGWSSEIVQFGEESRVLVTIVLERGRTVEAFVRIDVRSDFRCELRRLARALNESGMCFADGDGERISAAGVVVLDVVDGSKEMRLFQGNGKRSEEGDIL